MIATFTESMVLKRLRSNPLAIFVFVILTHESLCRCPWPREVAELNNACLCAYNLENQISIQCTMVSFPLLMTVLHQRSDSLHIDLLFVNNSKINGLNAQTFDGLRIENIQISSCGIYNISSRTFVGLEDSLKKLNLQDNLLSNAPSEALSILKNLQLLDLSSNELTSIPDNAFQGTSISTLKLADNALSLSANAFGGLEATLKNLNLKGTNLKTIPEALTPLRQLAFLDLAQNQIRKLDPGSFSTLSSLTALNLERNLLQNLPSSAFFGVEDTLSSLSLLNNLLTEFPSEAFSVLKEIRVLDIGFNLLTSIPVDGFRAIKSLTLLALDGNPLSSVPEEAFSHLNESLRGLSIGGRFLNCDCNVAWISRWIRDFDLQVTSRDRNPQFCGQPVDFRERSFYQLSSEDFPCNETKKIAINMIPFAPQEEEKEQDTEDRPSEKVEDLVVTTSLQPVATTTTSYPTTTSLSPHITYRPSIRGAPIGLNRAGVVSDVRGTEINHIPRGTHRVPPRGPHQNRVPILRRPEIDPGPYFNKAGPAKGPFDDEVIIQGAYRSDNSVVIQWDSEVTNILGFRVVYRLFGKNEFKLGPPLANTEREFRIRNVPSQECIVVCVVSLEDTSVSPENVPLSQCKEVRTETSATVHMDIIIIAASAAICGTVIISVIIFICSYRRRNSVLEKQGIPALLSPAAPLASLGTLGGGTKADWDTLSMYSQRSIPRARLYHLDRDDARSHISHLSGKNILRTRSMADGQSQRSYSGLSAHHGPFGSAMSLSRPDLHLSRQSLAASQFGVPIYPTGMNPTVLSRAQSQRSDRRRTRSKSRERTSSRMSQAGSSHSQTGYDTDGWTDHDMDIYIARNPTKGGLVKL